MLVFKLVVNSHVRLLYDETSHIHTLMPSDIVGTWKYINNHPVPDHPVTSPTWRRCCRRTSILHVKQRPFILEVVPVWLSVSEKWEKGSDMWDENRKYIVITFCGNWQPGKIIEATGVSCCVVIQWTHLNVNFRGPEENVHLTGMSPNPSSTCYIPKGRGLWKMSKEIIGKRSMHKIREGGSNARSHWPKYKIVCYSQLTLTKLESSYEVFSIQEKFKSCLSEIIYQLNIA